MSIWPHIAAQISAATGRNFEPSNHTAIAGGCINEAIHLHDGQQHYFVKLHQANQWHMFDSEAQSLMAIEQSLSIKTPKVITWGCVENRAFLALEHLNLRSSTTPDGARQLGLKLAQMHRHTNKQFGWHQNNTIGTNAQINDWHSNWLTFWRDQRLGHQLNLAYSNGFAKQLERPGEQLLKRLAEILQDHTPEASLLHGDLWSGNYAFTEGQPVIFDPASYYGDRETDIAITELFGGFDPAFYQAYSAAHPLEAGYEQRKTLYNLYHILNHLNLFGRGYLGQAEQMINTLLGDY